MKPSIIIIACLALSLFACNQDTELVNKDDMPYAQIDSGNTTVPDVGSATDAPTKCTELTTTHWLTGVGHFLPVREKLINDQTPNSIIAGQYLISASGDAASDVYARGFTKLNMVYNARNKQLTGSVITEFYNGEILNLNMDGVARVQNDGKTMKITVKITDATFKTLEEVLKLQNGEISIVLPVKPEGQLSMNIDTKEILCRS